MRTRIPHLQDWPIFARGTSLSGGWRGNPIEAAIGLQSAQDAFAQVTALAPQLGSVIASIQDDNGLGGQGFHHLLQLFYRRLDRRRLRTDALLIQDEGATTGWFRQDDHGRELPAKGDGLLGFRQIMDWYPRAISSGDRERTSYATGIDANPEPITLCGFGHVARQHLAQAGLIQLTILKRFVDASPFALKPQRLRHFWQRFGRRFRAQRVDGIEQSVFCFQEAIVHLLTKLLQCVKVHLSNVPLPFLQVELYSIRPLTARVEGLLSGLV